MKLYCDNINVVEGFKKMRAAISRKWKQQFVLKWAKGHPDERDALHETWTLVDWMIHVADRAAEAEYGRTGGEDAPACLRHQGRWRLEWNGKRVTSVTSDALNWIQEVLSREMLRAELRPV